MNGIIFKIQKLKQIKDDIKQAILHKCIEINDNTPLKDYSKLINNSGLNLIKIGINKEKLYRKIIDNVENTENCIIPYLTAQTTTDNEGSWSATASHYSADTYKLFNNETTNNSYWSSGGGWGKYTLKLTFPKLYKIQRVTIMDGVSPDSHHIKNALIQARESNEDDWITIGQINSTSNVSGAIYNFIFKENAQQYFKEFQLNVLSTHSNYYLNLKKIILHLGK